MVEATFDDQLASLERAVRERPDNRELAARLGRLYERAGRRFVGRTIGEWTADLGERTARAEAARALGDIGPAASCAVPALIEALDPHDRRAFEAAAEALGKIRDPRAAPALAREAACQDGLTGAAAARSLAALGPTGPRSALVEELIAALNDPEPRRRGFAIRRLQLLRSEEGLRALIRRWPLEDGELRLGLISAFEAAGDARAGPSVEEGLDAPDPRLRLKSLRCLSKLSGYTLRPALERGLADPSADLRRAALELAADRREHGLAGAILELFRCDLVPRIRCLAAAALGAIGEPGACAALEEGLADNAPGVKAAAARALGQINAPRSVPALFKALADNPWAAVALGRAGDPRSRLPLLAILREARSPEKLRCEAAEALGNLADRAALPSLQCLIRGANRAVGLSARAAAAKIAARSS